MEHQKGSSRAWWHLVDYMDARWHRDTYREVLSRLDRGMVAEARYLVYADLHYLDSWKHERILGELGRPGAVYLVHRLKSEEADRMESNRAELLKFHLINLDTEGQMKMVVELKGLYYWNIVVRIGIHAREESKEPIRQLANSAGIPIEEDPSEEYDIFKIYPQGEKFLVWEKFPEYLCAPEEEDAKKVISEEEEQLNSGENCTESMSTPEEDDEDMWEEYKPNVTTDQKEEEQLNSGENSTESMSAPEEDDGDDDDIWEEYKPNVTTDQKEEEQINSGENSTECIRAPESSGR